MADDTKKIICPDCDTENKAEEKKCTKCALPFELGETVSISDMFRIMDAREKRKAKQQPEKKSGFKLF